MSLSKLQGEKMVEVRLWAPIGEVESQALDQLKNIARLPWVFHHVAAMPDVHLGKGATVGSVIAMKGAVAPAAVGVDIGCGVNAIRTNLKASDLPENLDGIYDRIVQDIPHGNGPQAEHAELKANRLSMKLKNEIVNLFEEFGALTPEVQDLLSRAKRQIGTLGGGNHFIELCLDTEDNVWLMLHSGSRNIGKSLAEVHMGRAKKLAHNTHLPDRDLSVFLSNTPEMKAYRTDLFWAQEYARLNRAVMMENYVNGLKVFLPQLAVVESISCHHNYVAEERHYGEDLLVTRKGAIKASKGVLGVIPGSMNTGSYIVRGLGNHESFESASHGAGRKMSRGEAKRRYTVADVVAQTEGVKCRKDEGIIDEIPAAYKDIENVMSNQRDLVEVVTRLKQIICVKG
jgi:tRNA-splicing ligase RtcB